MTSFSFNILTNQIEENVNYRGSGSKERGGRGGSRGTRGLRGGRGSYRGRRGNGNRSSR